MKPILAASIRAPVLSGAHRYVLQWTVPAGLKPGISRQLSAEWSWSAPDPGEAEREVADFAVPLPASAMSPVTAAERLHAMALRSVASCHGARPDWILGVRTTFSKASGSHGFFSS